MRPIFLILLTPFICFADINPFIIFKDSRKVDIIRQDLSLTSAQESKYRKILFSGSCLSQCLFKKYIKRIKELDLIIIDGGSNFDGQICRKLEGRVEAIQVVYSKRDPEICVFKDNSFIEAGYLEFIYNL